MLEIDKDSGLSEYEIIRLQNIHRNNQFLVSLGLDAVKSEIGLSNSVPPTNKKSNKRKITSIPVLGTRRSKRLNFDDELETHEQKVEDEDTLESDHSLEGMPENSDDLDDLEFEAFAKLKKWRLMRCRELDIEPFKVFQDRPLCEIVRRRRLDPNWANPVTLESNESNIDLNFQKVSNDLLECWGIGPSKVKEGGFAHQALTVINGPETEALLQLSRLNHNKDRVDSEPM
jgi:hypothetical protein